jgi:hypothetical protein
MDIDALHRDFSEFLQCLSAGQVEFLVIGGYAVMAHGYYRSTGDLDVWVRRSPANARRLIEALVEFGFGSSALTQELVLKRGAILRMGVMPNRIEILNDIAGVDFDDCYPRRERARIGDVEIPLIALEDLKRKSARRVATRTWRTWKSFRTKSS